MQNQEKRNVLYVDFDLTLVSTKSVNYVYKLHKNRFLIEKSFSSLLSFLKVILAIPLIGITHLIDSKLRDRITYNLYRGFKADLLQFLCDNFWEKYSSRVNQPVVEKVKDHKNRGFLIVIISGSFREVIVSAVKTLGLEDLFDHIISTELVINEERIVTGKLKSYPVVSTNKAKAIKQFESHLGFQGERICITDSLDDGPLIEVSKKSYLVNPTNKLIMFCDENSIHYEIIDIS